MPDDPISKAVETCANELREVFPDVELMLVHIVKGLKKQPYFARRSAIRIGENQFNFLPAEKRSPARHKEVLDSYINYLDRDFTLLDRILHVFETAQRQEDL